MQEADRPKFMQGMVTLRECYGGTWWGSPDEWTRRLKAYWDDLSGVDYADVRSAIDRATDPDCYPDRFPNSGQLKRLAFDARRQRVEREKVVMREKPGELFDLGPPALDPSNPFEALALEWESKIRMGQKLDGAACARAIAELWPDDFGQMPGANNPQNQQQPSHHDGEEAA